MTQLDLSFDSVFGNQPAAPPKNNIDLSFDSVFGNAPYGYRVDGTPKGEGWLGLIPMNDGRQMSELSVGVEFDGKETLIPAIVPGLSDEQIEYLKSGGDPRDNREIMQMAQDHAMQRMRAGQSPFADAKKPKPSYLEKDKDRFDIGRGVMRQAQEYLDSGKPIEDIDEDILSFMLSDDSRAEYVLEENQYNKLRQALQDRQSEELGTFGGILAEVTDVAKTAASGAVGVIASTPQALGRAYETIRDTAIDMVADTDTPVGQVIDIVTRQMLEKQTKPMIKGGEKLDEVSRELLETELFANKAAEMNMKLNDPRTWVMSVSRGAGQMIPMLAAGAVTGGTGVAVFGYGMGADQIYDGVYDVLGKAEGMPTEERDRIARNYAAVGGAISAVLEMAGIEKVLGRIGKNKTTLGQYFKDIAVASMAEGLTEAAQTSLEQTLNYMADETIPMDERVNIATKFVENMFTSETALAAGTGAIVGGGAVAVGSPVASKIDEKKLRKKFVEPYVRDRQPEPDQIEIEGQQYIRQESTGNLIPATPENIAQESEAQRATIETDLQTQEAEDTEFLEATGENYVVVRDGEVVGEFDPAGSDELNESLRASGRDPDETDMQDFAFDEAERVAAVEGGEVMLESEYLRDTREQQAAERRRTLAETDPELIELTPAEQSLQVIDRAATDRTGVQHTSRVMTSRESSPVANKIRTIGERAGLEIVVVDTQTDEGVSAFPAVIDPTNSRRIFVEDSGSQSEMLKLVFGHELFHTLEKENPDLYDALVSQLPSQFRQRLAEYRATGMLGDNPTVSQQLSEGFAALTEQSLLGLGTESLFDGDATKIQRFKDFVRRMMVRLGMQGKYAKDVLNVMQQIAGGVDLADIGLTKKQERRVDRLRRDAARSRPAETQAQPQPETAPVAGVNQDDVDVEPVAEPDAAPVAGVTQEDIDAEPDPTVQFAAAPPVQSPEFRRWFKNSKVVDEQGKPQVVYHGTNAKFDAFDSEKIGSATDTGFLGEGFYFSDDSRVADGREYSMQVYLSIQAPLRLKLNSFKQNKSQLIANELGIDLPAKLTAEFSKTVTRSLVDAGYDGVILDYSPTGYKANEAVVFDPTQIKSATANVGTFDPSNPDIQFAARRVPKVNYRTANASEIIAAHKANKRQSFLSPKDPDDLQSDIDRGKVIAVISNDGTSGYLLDRNDPDDISLGYDIQGVFNIGPVKGAGQAALADAISRGGRTLDAYDGYLPALYSSYGFVETHRAPYNEEFASAEFGPMEGRPDVVLMTYVREETDAEQIIAAKSEPTTAAPGPYNIAKDGSNWPDYATRVAGLLRAPVSEQPADGRDVRATGEDTRRLLEEEVQFAARRTITTGSPKVDLQTAIDLVARTGVSPEEAASQVGVEPTKPNITAIRAKSQASLREVKGKTVGGVPVTLAVPSAIGTVPLGKPVAAGTPNADTLLQLDVLAAEYPNVLQSESTFIEFLTATTRTKQVPPPAYRALEYNEDPKVLEEMLDNINEPMLDAAAAGIAQGDAFRKLAEQGNATPEVTALLFLWGVNSKMLTPYYQEASALDVYRNPELRDLINKAVAGDFNLQDWFDAVDRMYGPEFKGPGKSAKANLRSYGKFFLSKMSELGPSGNTYLQELHDMFWDYEIPSATVRRRFLTDMPKGLGLQSKVFSFLMLVSGRRDVLVMDRIAIRHLYDDGRYDNRASLYEDLASMYDGGIGLAMYEALERSLATLVKDAYANIGRPEDGDLAHFHWESWNNYGFQEATHGSLEYVSAFMASDTEGMALAHAAEGRGNTVEYGARWQLVDGVASIVYPTPYLETEAWLFDGPAFSGFSAALRLEANGVLPKRWYDKSRQLKAEGKAAKAGIVTAGVIRKDVAEELVGGQVWYASEGIDYGKIESLAEQYGQPHVEAVGEIVSGPTDVSPGRAEPQFAARRVPSKKEQTRWLTGQVKDPELLEMQAKYRSASPIAKEAYREGRREAKAEAKEQREVYTTAAKGILDVARNRQKKLKSGFKDIEQMRRELRELMQKVLSPKVRGRYLAMLDNVRTEGQMKTALQRVVTAAAKSGWSDEVSRYRRAVKRVGRHKDIPDSVRKELDELIERGKRQSTEKVAIKSGPNTGKLTTRKKNIGGVQANVEATIDLAKTADEMLEKLLAALEYKRVTKEGRGVMIGTAIDEILKDLRAGAKPLKRAIQVRGKKADARAAQDPIKTGKFKTALLWHRQVPNIIKVITRKPNGESIFHKLFVDDVRTAESKMELRKQQIIKDLEQAARDSGFKNLEDASVRLDASHGVGLANPMIEVTLGGKKVQLLEGELLHLALMDAGTVEQIIYNNVPLKVARGGESAIVFGDVENGGRPITNQEFSEALGKLDPKVLAYGQYLKNKINSLSPEMQQSLRKLQGYDAEMIPDYFPISRDISETKFGSEIDINDMLSGKSGVGKSAVLFAENSGQTKSRVKSKLPIFIKPATNVFSQHIDSTMRIIYMAEAIRNADAITRDSRVKAEITNRHGTRVYQALRQYLTEASGINEHQSGGLGTFFRALTGNLAGSYLALNPSTMLVQFSGVPRLYGRVNFTDMIKGVAWATKNINRLGSIMEQHGYFADRWSRSTITRFGPQQYSGLVPVNKDGFMRGVGDSLRSLTRMDMKSFSRSWKSANDSIQILDAIDKYICGIAYGANLARAKRESPQLSEANLQERALEGAVLDVRETQNSSSRLDFSVAASDWRRTPQGEAFLLFSSDKFTLLNRLAHGKRLLQEGKKTEGARIVMGSMVSMATEVPIRQAYWTMITAGVFALFGGEDDDRKKAERAEKAEEVWYTNIVRSFVGMSPIFGGIFETAASLFVDKMYADAFMSSAVGDAVSNIARTGKRATNEFLKLTDEEQEASIDVAIANTVNMLSQIAAITTGNPLHPIVNKLMRGWAGNGNDPVGDLNKLDTYYSGVEELTDEQRENADEVKRENKGIKRQASRIRSQMKALRVRAAAGESVEAEMRGLQVRMAELELRSMKILGYDTEDLQEYADEKGISLEQ